MFEWLAWQHNSFSICPWISTSVYCFVSQSLPLLERRNLIIQDPGPDGGIGFNVGGWRVQPSHSCHGLTARHCHAEAVWIHSSEGSILVATSPPHWPMSVNTQLIPQRSTACWNTCFYLLNCSLFQESATLACIHSGNCCTLNKPQ